MDAFLPVQNRQVMVISGTSARKFSTNLDGQISLTEENGYFPGEQLSVQLYNDPAFEDAILNVAMPFYTTANHTMQLHRKQKKTLSVTFFVDTQNCSAAKVLLDTTKGQLSGLTKNCTVSFSSSAFYLF